MANQSIKDIKYLFDLEAKKKEPNRNKLMRLAQKASILKAEPKELELMAKAIAGPEKKTSGLVEDIKESFNLFRKENEENKREARAEKIREEEMRNLTERFEAEFPDWSIESLEAALSNIVFETHRVYGGKSSVKKSIYVEELISNLKEAQEFQSQAKKNILKENAEFQNLVGSKDILKIIK